MVCGLLKTVIANDDRSYMEESYPRNDFPSCRDILIPILDGFYKRGLLCFISYFRTALVETSRFVFVQPFQLKESMA